MNASFIGHDTQTNRKLILYSLAAAFDNSGRYFVTMLVWNADNVTDAEITVLSRKLIDAGCAYLCCWGAGCERVHDLFDSEWVESGFNNESDDTIMTTWHTDDTLDEFIYFSLLHTEPTNKYQNDCRSVVALVIDDAVHADKIRDAFANPSLVYAEHDS